MSYPLKGNYSTFAKGNYSISAGTQLPADDIGLPVAPPAVDERLAARAGISDKLRGTEPCKEQTDGSVNEECQDIAPRRAQRVRRLACGGRVLDPRHGIGAAAGAGHARLDRGGEEGRA